MEYACNNRLPLKSLFLIVVAFSFSMFLMLGSVQESFSGKTGSIDISLINSSFIPLSNADANQVKAYVEYALENEKIQNQLVNAVMEVYASNGTLIRTTSIGSGFTLQSDEGEQVLKTSIDDKSLEMVSLKILFTDLSKKIPLSNVIMKEMKLQEPFRTD